MRVARVLLIDDQEIVAQALWKMLAGEADIELHYCQEPTQAVARALDLEPTVILQDLVMPGMDGIALVRALRAEPAIRNVPLVVLSTKEDPEVKAEAFAAGANDYLVKLPDVRELLARLRYHSASCRSLQERDQAYAYIRQTFGRYVSDEVVAKLLETGGLALGGERRRVTLLMSDLRGFSQLTENLPPEQVVTLLNNYLGVMTRVIARHGGTIDEFIGDAILAIFGAPVQRADDARRAVACALEMQLAIPRVDARNEAVGLPRVTMGIGLDTGEVVAGNLGSATRAKYGVVGTHVNNTARIEGHTVGGQVLISGATRDAAAEPVEIDDEMEISLKGSDATMTVYSVRGFAGLELPARPPIPPLESPLLVRFTLADSDASHRGRVVRMSQTEADIVTTAPPPPPGTWIRLGILEERGGVRWGARGEVLPRPVEGGFALRFSPVTADVVAFVRKLSAP
jgi:adenylate cyclase